jgi:hypothetical protein
MNLPCRNQSGITEGDVLICLRLSAARLLAVEIGVVNDATSAMPGPPARRATDAHADLRSARCRC